MNKNRKSLEIKESDNISNLHTKDSMHIDIFLEMVTCLVSKDNNSKCLCTNEIPEINNKDTFIEKEIVPSMEVNLHCKRIKLSEVISSLKILGYPLTGASISIHYNNLNEFVYIGCDPINQNIFLEQSVLSQEILKMRVISHIDEKLILNNKISRQSSKIKRTKERKIGYIVEKVNKWRKLYNGFYDEYGKFTKYSLDEAAKILDISKKSLDDYLLQLRLGRKYGFDFNLNKNTKVGVLRSFVKERRALFHKGLGDTSLS